MPPTIRHFYDFGHFRLDTEDHRLLYKDESIFLTSKAYEILLALLQSDGKVLGKDQMINKIWPDKFVDDANLTQQIFVLRRILAADESQLYIETIPRRGYRFTSTVRVPEDEDQGKIVADQTKVLEIVEETRSTTGSTITSLAVLPLDNFSDNPNTEHLPDGITESIINNLSQLRELRVMSWSSVAKYKGRNIDLHETGRELHVQAILTGKVLQVSNRLIIRMELVDVVNGWQLWGVQYNRSVADLAAIEEDVSWEVSETLRLKLSDEEKGRITKRYPDTTEPYQLYLKGRCFWNKRSVEGMKRAIEFIEEAVKKDPSYALGYAALADCYSILSCLNGRKSREGSSKAKAAALKALSLDDNLAEAHASLALVRMLFDLDWSNAEKEFKCAIALNPNYAMSHHWYGIFLARMERFDDSLVEISLAHKLDPTSLIIINNLGLISYLTHNYDRAIEYGQEALELDPTFSAAYSLLCIAHLQKGLYGEAENDCQMGLKLSDRDPEALAFLALIQAKLSDKTKIYEVVEELRELFQRRYVSPFYLALAYIVLQEKKSALDCIEETCASLA